MTKLLLRRLTREVVELESIRMTLQSIESEFDEDFKARFEQAKGGLSFTIGTLEAIINCDLKQ